MHTTLKGAYSNIASLKVANSNIAKLRCTYANDKLGLILLTLPNVDGPHLKDTTLVTKWPFIGVRIERSACSKYY